MSDEAKKLDAWRDLARAQSALLVAYRLGRSPADPRAAKAIDAITDAKERLEALGEKL